MQYLISFLEGFVTFISPCLLPMLPVYLSYFAGTDKDKKEPSVKSTVIGALGFVLGFTVVFVALGALAGTLGGLLTKYKTVLNILTGAVVVFFGLHFLGVFELKLFSGFRFSLAGKRLGFFSAMLFGVVFSVGWTPCVGAFLGSALMMASTQGKALSGILMLLCYSAGLGIPFLISAVLIDRLKNAFGWIKRNYKIINLVCGGFLVLIGILMMTGLMGRFLTLLG